MNMALGFFAYMFLFGLLVAHFSLLGCILYQVSKFNKNKKN